MDRHFFSFSIDRQADAGNISQPKFSSRPGLGDEPGSRPRAVQVVRDLTGSDLRNGILAMAELALHTELSPEQGDYLQTLKLSADSLLEVINDILDFSKMEAGKLDLRRAEPETLKERRPGIKPPLPVHVFRKLPQLRIGVEELLKRFRLEFLLRRGGRGDRGSRRG